MPLTSLIEYVQALDTSATDGSGKTGLAFGDITAKYLTQGGVLTALTTETITTLGTYQAPTSNAHIRIKELANTDPTKGIYEVHFHNDQVAAAGKRLRAFFSATGARFIPLALDLLLNDVKSLNESTQSLTDLKDLVDTGYDPSTHKIQGVVTVDTTTTNTDMRGTDGAYTGTPPSASDISNQVNSDITTAHGNGSYQTATGFAVPGDAMALTSGERTSVATAVWSSATRTLSSFGTLVSDIWSYVTRTLTSGAAPSAAENAAAVWDEALAGHNTAGSAGAALSAAQSAGDPWSTTVPGAYASGTAGHKFGNLPSSSGIASALTGVSSVEFMGSPMQGPRVVIVRGSAYLQSQSMAPYQRIAKAAYPDMGLDTVVGFRMKVYRSDDTFEVIVDGVIESYDATYWNLYADLSSADTALLIVGEGVAQFWVELDGIAEEITVSEYKLTVKHGVGVA